MSFPALWPRGLSEGFAKGLKGSFRLPVVSLEGERRVTMARVFAPTDEQRKRTLGDRAIAHLRELIGARGKCAVFKREECRAVDGRAVVAVNQMADAAFHFYEILEDDLVAPIELDLLDLEQSRGLALRCLISS